MFRPEIGKSAFNNLYFDSPNYMSNVSQSAEVSRRGFLKESLRLAAAGTIGAGIATGVHRTLNAPLDERIKEVIERTSPNCCKIAGEKKMCLMCGGEHQGCGSGVVLQTKQGKFILTCHHVAQSSEQKGPQQDAVFDVSMWDEEEKFKASPVLLQDGSRAYSEVGNGIDIALLRIPPNCGKTEGLRLRKGEVETGESVVTVGFPSGMQLVGSGIVSGREVVPPPEAGSNFPHVFTTSPINAGGSGGAMVGMDGKLIALPRIQVGGEAQNMAGGIRNDEILKQMEKWGIEAL